MESGVTLDQVADALESMAIVKETGAKLHSLKHDAFGHLLTFADTKHPSGKPYYVAAILTEDDDLEDLVRRAMSDMRRSRIEDPKGER